jgi:hypothetical protein
MFKAEFPTWSELKEIWQEEKNAWEYFDFQRKQGYIKEPIPINKFHLFINFIFFLFRLLTCCIEGHIIESESCINGDSGTEYFYCTRCGWANTVYWY